MNIFKRLMAPQLGQNWRDRTKRGNGNRAARRAIATKRGQEHILFAGEDTYTDRPWIFTRGLELSILGDGMSITVDDDSRSFGPWHKKTLP